MRRVVFVIIMWLSLVATVKAQSSLSISPLFEGKIVPQEHMVETRVKGRALSKYQLTFFRSVRFSTTDSKEFRRIRSLVEQDQQRSISSQSQKRNGVETIMLQLPKENGQNRFLCFKGQKTDITVIYMEGSLSSFDTLKNILK